jgi:hypothetical protein
MILSIQVEQFTTLLTTTVPKVFGCVVMGHVVRKMRSSDYTGCPGNTSTYSIVSPPPPLPPSSRAPTYTSPSPRPEHVSRARRLQQPCFPEYTLFYLVEAITTLQPSALDRTPRLQAWFTAFAQRKGIAAYRASGRRAEMFNGNTNGQSKLRD